LIPNHTNVWRATPRWGTPPNNTVLIGAVPYADLGIPAKFSLDAQGNKLLYAVTESLTDSATYGDTKGIIHVLDKNGTMPMNADRAHYVVLSFGKDKKGAFTPTGVQAVPCPITAVTRDDTNCDNDARFSDNYDSTTAASQINNVPITNSEHFDDRVKFDYTTTGGFWQRNVPGVDIYNASRRVSVGNPTDPVAMVDVWGDMRTDRLVINRLCDTAEGIAVPNSPTGTLGCNGVVSVSGVTPTPSGIQYASSTFAPGIFADTLVNANAGVWGGGIACSPTTSADGHYIGLRKIAYSDEVCATFPSTYTLGATCSGTTAPIGFTSTGAFNCITPP
jgi:hypothetical protein